MSSKRSSHKRKEIKPRKSDESEVFVLPPHLLQKLGINLNHIQCKEERLCTIENELQDKKKVTHYLRDESSQKQYKNTEQCGIDKKTADTSISETANLMKKSVFLSPTFIPEIASMDIINAEIEFLCSQGKESTSNTALQPLNKSEDCNDCAVNVVEEIGSINNNNLTMQAQENNIESQIKKRPKLVSSNESETDIYDILDSDEILGNTLLVETKVLTPNTNTLVLVDNETLPNHTKTLKVEETPSLVDIKTTLVDTNTSLVDGKIPVIDIKSPLINSQTPKNETLKAVTASPINNAEFKMSNLTPQEIKSMNKDSIFSKDKKFHDITIYEDNSDEAYLSDTNNLILASITDSIHDNQQVFLKDKEYQESNHKINIVSEEVLETSKFHELMRNPLFSPKRENMFSVNVNDVVELRHKYCSTLINTNHCDNNAVQHVNDDTEDNRGKDTNTLRNVNKNNELISTQIEGFENISETEITNERKYSLFDNNVDCFNTYSRDKRIQTDDRDNKQILKERMADFLNNESHENRLSGVLNKSNMEICNQPVKNDYLQVNDLPVPFSHLLAESCSASETKLQYCDEINLPGNKKKKLNYNPKTMLYKNIYTTSSRDTIITNDVINYNSLASNIGNESNCQSSNTGIQEIKYSDIRSKNEKVEISNNNDTICRIASYLEKFTHVLVNRKRCIEKRTKINLKKNHEISEHAEEGVEKPGGLQKNTKIIQKKSPMKSYIRSANRQLPTPISYPNFDSNYENITEKVNNRQNVVRRQQYCLCGDFGSLSFYDSTDLYQHLHFQQLISYNMSDIFMEKNYVEYIENQIKNSEIYVNDNSSADFFDFVCWHSVEKPDDYGYEESEDNFEPINMNQQEILGRIKQEQLTLKDQLLREIKCVQTIYRSDKLKMLVDNTQTKEVNNESISKETIEPQNYHKIGQAENCANYSGVNDINVDKINNDVLVKTEESTPTGLPKYKRCSNRLTSEKITSFAVMKAGMKRRRSAVACSISKDAGSKKELSSSPAAKKYIKCGVCKVVLGLGEWDAHRCDEHCYIAWMDGEVFDLDSESLLKKIKDLATKGENLKCTFCGKQNKDVKHFLLHIRKCLEKHMKLQKNLNHCKSEKIKSSRKLQISSKDVTETNPVNTCPSSTSSKKTSVQTDEGAESKLDDYDLKETDKHIAELEMPRKSIKTEHNSSVEFNRIRRNLRFTKRNSSVESVPGPGQSNHKSKVSLLNSLDIPESNQKLSDLKVPRKVADVQQNGYDQEDSSINKRHNNDKSKSNPVKNYKSRTSSQKNENIEQKDEKVSEKMQASSSPCAENSEKNDTMKKKFSKKAKKSNHKDSEKKTDSFKTKNVNNHCKCGVCGKQIHESMWLHHIKNEHNYIAWKSGENAVNLDDVKEVHDHLKAVSKTTLGLQCKKCGIFRKYPKAYLSHVENCDGRTEDNNVSLDMSKPSTDTSLSNHKPQTSEYELNEKDKLTCAICEAEVSPDKWKAHAMDKHYNIAWSVGDTPIDIRNVYAVERHLKLYKNLNKNLVCKVCKISRASCSGFYAHILVCGKTEEETDKFRNVCEICNQKYLCIYRQQHMIAHKEAELAKERKRLATENSINEEKNCEPQLDLNISATLSGRRKAAEKAKNVLENYKEEGPSEYKYNCESCEYATNNMKHMKKHNCIKDEDNSEDFFVTKSAEQSDESEIDSDISAKEEELHPKKKKKKSTRSKCLNVPFPVQDPKAYLLKSAKDFVNLHFTNEVLFPDWRHSQCELVPDAELTRYLPPIEESCKFDTTDGWITYKRFEVRLDKVHSFFIGASPQCLEWAPPRYKSEDRITDDNFLAIACHKGMDLPKQKCNMTYEHPSLIQIWDFGKFDKLPKLSMGIALECGTIWSMSWCASGTRDVPDKFKKARLGLLAVACSNGCAYIFSVPHPSTLVKSDKLFYKLKPVVELRLTTKENKCLQCTAIAWSTQKDHAVIVAGYSDGTIAFYNLNCDSPLGRTQEDGVTIFYPFHDERLHNNCITSVDVMASNEGGVGAVGASCPTGASLTARGGVTPAAAARTSVHCAAATALFIPHWPSLLLTDDAVSLSELEWFGSSRRPGLSRLFAGCLHCGIAVSATSPLLRKLNPHPVFKDTNKMSILAIEMKPLSKKGSRKSKINTEISMKLEPFTYEAAIQQYGLQLTLLDKKHVFAQSNVCDVRPERFPLADVACMSFCPSPQYHNRFAIATLAGIIFLVNIL